MQQSMLLLFYLKKGQEAIKDLKRMSSQIFEDVFEGVPQAKISLIDIKLWNYNFRCINWKNQFLKIFRRSKKSTKRKFNKR